MKQPEIKFFGIFNCKNDCFQDKLFAFQGKYKKEIESIGTTTDEIGESFVKIWHHKNDKLIFMAKHYAIKYNPNASENVLLFAYQNNENNFYKGQYVWLNQDYFPSISSIESMETIETIALKNKIFSTLAHKPLYFMGELSMLAFGKNKNSLIDYHSQIKKIYEDSNKKPPSKPEIETCFKRIKHLSF